MPRCVIEIEESQLLSPAGPAQSVVVQNTQHRTLRFLARHHTSHRCAVRRVLRCFRSEAIGCKRWGMRCMQCKYPLSEGGLHVCRWH